MNTTVLISDVFVVVLVGILALNLDSLGGADLKGPMLSDSGLVEESSTSAVAISQVYQNIDCGIEKPSVTRINSAEGWQEVTQKKGVLGTKLVPVPEFDGATYYLVSGGRKPSYGYYFQLLSTEAAWNNDELLLPLKMKEPEGIAATMMTSPCVVVRLEGDDIEPVVLGRAR